jgi:hypothetical protein
MGTPRARRNLKPEIAGSGLSALARTRAAPDWQSPHLFKVGSRAML